MKDSILVLCAHNDDNIIGAGGTITQYSREGKKVKTIIFSYGEMGNPHLKEKVVREMRYKESKKAEAILKGGGITYLGLKEGKFLENKEKTLDQLKQVIKKLKPGKIFTHSINDPHPDHRAVYQVVQELTEKSNTEVYSFDVWNIVNIKHRNRPVLVVDISETFRQKIKAFRAHKSQRHVMILLLGKIFIKDWTNGLRHGCKFAEVFVKLK